MTSNIALWLGFNAFVIAMLALDLGLFHRKARPVSPREAIAWTLVWIVLSMAFCAGIWVYQGAEKGVEFLTGYAVEYSLSVDNLFVFLMVFGYFKVAPEHRHKLLFWGIMGAFVMRASMILVGMALVKRFDWLLYIFGAFLVYTGAKMLFSKEENIDPSHNPILKLARRIFPVAHMDHGESFVAKEHGKWVVTPLFLVLVVIEATDLLFALDSIPAILGITSDPFIAYTSNVCAILGLRSLFFVVASLMDKFHYLKIGLAVVLAFVGGKMIVHSWVHVSSAVSLGVILTVLALSVVGSAIFPIDKEKLPPERLEKH